MKKVVCLGFSFWKKKFISKYLAPVVCIFEKSDYFEKKNPGAKNNEHFRNSSGNINIAFWASQFIRDPYINRLEYFYRNNSDCFSIIHIEDGFIRSNGREVIFSTPTLLFLTEAGSTMIRPTNAIWKKYYLLLIQSIRMKNIPNYAGRLYH